MRKTDDALLLQMWNNGRGKSKHLILLEIADFFGCSYVNAWRRVKKLTDPEPQFPLSFSKLTDKQQRFVIEKWVKKKTSIQAVLNSYEVTSRDSAKAMGTKLMADPDIQTAIHDFNGARGPA